MLKFSNYFIKKWRTWGRDWRFLEFKVYTAAPIALREDLRPRLESDWNRAGAAFTQDKTRCSQHRLRKSMLCFRPLQQSLRREIVN